MQIHEIMFDEEDIGLDLQNVEDGKDQKTMKVVSWMLKAICLNSTMRCKELCYFYDAHIKMCTTRMQRES
ncbi:hypothetical protein CHS0354_034264 [Potamilus streckersoni]|uniref:Uncharacterized protein n=1 Tax=Potamilus streckersoni TaxID=2493646 RepID=A0AAE0VP62_9BIVA|nr:hypothetical protein CHS0354_034264 [Potamilus streckersoni]